MKRQCWHCASRKSDFKVLLESHCAALCDGVGRYAKIRNFWIFGARILKDSSLWRIHERSLTVSNIALSREQMTLKAKSINSHTNKETDAVHELSTSKRTNSRPWIEVAWLVGCPPSPVPCWRPIGSRRAAPGRWCTGTRSFPVCARRLRGLSTLDECVKFAAVWYQWHVEFCTLRLACPGADPGSKLGLGYWWLWPIKFCLL